MYKAILFDLDGTLTESGEGITKCVQYALEKLGRPELDLEKLKVFIGPPLMEQFMKYADMDEATARKAVEYYRERYSTTGIFENRPYPGVEKMLQELRRKKYLLAVASSKPEYYVKQILDYFNLKEYFDEIVGSEMNGARTNKTEVIEETLKRLGLDHHREQVIMVGDKEHDVLGARKAGLDCVAVSYGYGTEEELAASQPLQIVASAEEILIFSPEPPTQTKPCQTDLAGSISLWDPFFDFTGHWLRRSVADHEIWRGNGCLLSKCNSFYRADWITCYDSLSVVLQ